MTKYTWYKAYQNLLDKTPEKARRISNHFGYLNEPPYKDIEKYDLRFVDRCTIDELFDKYF